MRAEFPIGPSINRRWKIHPSKVRGRIGKRDEISSSEEGTEQRSISLGQLGIRGTSTNGGKHLLAVTKPIASENSDATQTGGKKSLSLNAAWIKNSFALLRKGIKLRTISRQKNYEGERILGS